jgi:hypothetical protein
MRSGSKVIGIFDFQWFFRVVDRKVVLDKISDYHEYDLASLSVPNDNVLICLQTSSTLMLYGSSSISQSESRSFPPGTSPTGTSSRRFPNHFHMDSDCSLVILARKVIGHALDLVFPGVVLLLSSEDSTVPRSQVSAPPSDSMGVFQFLA